jgi:HEAT repeat protein
VRAIGDSGEQAAIPYLLPLALGNDVNLRFEVTQSVRRLFTDFTAADYLELESLVHELTAYRDPIVNLSPSDIASLSALPDSEFLLGAACSHANGYVREAALKALANVSTGSELPFLFLRLNDWVEPVRTVAKTAVEQRLTPSYAWFFLSNLRLVTRLLACERTSHRAFVDRVMNFILHPECRDVLHKGMTSSDRWLRNQSLRLAAESSPDNLLEILQFACLQPEPSLRAWCVRKISPRLSEAELSEIGAELLRDSFMGVRCAALETMSEQLGARAAIHLELAVLDVSRSVRQIARFYLKRLQPNFDVAAGYRRHLATSCHRRLRVSLYGLGETGSANDAPVVCPYCQHTAPGIRRAAVWALARLNGRQYRAELLNALKDNHRGVSKEAANGLRRQSALLHGEDVWHIFQATTLLHVRTNALSVIESMSKWQRIAYIVMAMADIDPRIAEKATIMYRRWNQTFNRSFTKPTLSEMAKIHSVLRETESTIDDRIVRNLLQFLKSYE